MLAFLAAVALAKYRFHGRRLFVVLIIGVQMIPGIGLIIPLYVMLATSRCSASTSSAGSPA